MINKDDDMQKWIVVARYCSSNAWLIPRRFFAVSKDDALKKAEKRFPKRWCRYQLTQLIVLPYAEKYKGIKVEDELYADLPKFRRYKSHPNDTFNSIQRDRQVRHITGDKV